MIPFHRRHSVADTLITTLAASAVFAGKDHKPLKTALLIAELVSSGSKLAFIIILH